MRPTSDQIRERVKQRKAAHEELKTWQEPAPDAIVTGLSPASRLSYLDYCRRCRIEDARWAQRGLPSRRDRVMAMLGVAP